MTQILSNPAVIKRNEIIKLVRKWGDINTDGLLEESCQRFFLENVEGFIGYRVENSHAVVFGDPVCSEEDKPTLALAFQKHCEAQNLGVVYTIVSKNFAEWSFENLSASTVEFGEKFILNPQHNPTHSKGPHAVLVRKKIKHAIKDGVSVHEHLDEDPKVEKEIIDIAVAWLKRRKGPQIYLAHITLFNDREGKRWIYAKLKDQVVGFLVLNEIQAKQGWLLNNLILTQDAPHGTSELLIISALEILEKENCQFVEAGPVTRKNLGCIKGVNTAIEQLVRLTFKGVNLIFHLGGYEAFWTKFNPELEGSYLSFPKKNMGYSSVKALMAAYNMNLG